MKTYTVKRITEMTYKVAACDEVQARQLVMESKGLVVKVEGKLEVVDVEGESEENVIRHTLYGSWINDAQK